MRILWTLLKVIVGLAIAIPLGIVVLVVSLGIFGAMLGLALLALKLAFVGVVGYGLYRAARFFFAPAPSSTTRRAPELSMPDPYYESAMRELDAEMSRAPSR